MQRKAIINRKSKETQSKGTLNIDGKGLSKIKTPIGFLNHMLDLFTFHGFFDLTLDIKGDTDVDTHHSNEDIGIVLGKLYKDALGHKIGIKRFGSAFAPMEDTLGHTVIDLSGRGCSTFEIDVDKNIKDQEGYNYEYLEHFLESFAHNLGATICVEIVHASKDIHTNVETVFKSLGMALDQAAAVDPRRKGKVPSTKGIID